MKGLSRKLFTTYTTLPRAQVFALTDFERYRQDKKWGPQRWPMAPAGPDWERVFAYRELCAKEECERAAKNGATTWYHVVHEELSEIFNAKTPSDQLNEIVHTIAVLAHMGEQLIEDGVEFEVER